MLTSGCCCLVMLAIVAAAPVQEQGKDVSVAEVQNQEKELQSLLHLADEQEKQKDVSVHEEHVQHVHDLNGLVMKEEETRKTVTDAKTGKLLSDVKQEVKSEGAAAAGAPPKVEVKTEVDVPAEGVHETLVQAEDEAGVAAAAADKEEEEEEEEDMGEESSPEAVAEYLYQTGDFDRFYTALAQLVNDSLMTEADAVNFAELVAQYYRQRVERYEHSVLVQRRAQRQPLPDLYPMTLVARESYPAGLEADDSYPLPLDNSDSYSLGQQEMLSENDLDSNAYDILGELVKEAFVAGDERAQAIVQELYNQAGSDDAEGAQLRSMLLELAAGGLQNPDAWEPETNVIRPIAKSEAFKDEAASNQRLLAENEKSKAQAAIAEAKPTAEHTPAAGSAAKPGDSHPAATAEAMSRLHAQEGNREDKSVEKRAPETV